MTGAELPLGNLLPEPMGRNTAAAVAERRGASTSDDGSWWCCQPTIATSMSRGSGWRSLPRRGVAMTGPGDAGQHADTTETGTATCWRPVSRWCGRSPLPVERFLEKPTLDRRRRSSPRAAVVERGHLRWRRDVVRDWLARLARHLGTVVPAARWCRAVAAGIPRFARRPTTCPPSLLGEGRVAVVPVSWAGATSGAGMRSRDARRPTRGGPRRRRGDASSSVAALARACRRRPPGSWWGFVTPSWSPHRTRCRCAADTPGVKLVVERLIAEGRTERL